MENKRVGMFETSPSWCRVIGGFAFFGIGALALFLCLTLLGGWIGGSFDYQVPHTCAAGECLSAYASDTGRCEDFPPLVEKMRGTSGILWGLSRLAGIGLALAGLLLARFNFQMAWRCARPALPAPQNLRLIPLAWLVIPFTTLLVPVLSLWSLKPMGFFSI